MARGSAKAQSKKSKSSALAEHLHYRLREGVFILGSALAVFLFFSLITYHPEDPAWLHTSTTDEIANAGGRAGAWFSDVFFYLFGYLSFLFPAMVSYASWLIFKDRFAKPMVDPLSVIFRTLGFILTVASGAGLAALHLAIDKSMLPGSSGGILGRSLGHFLVGQFNYEGATLFLLALFLCGITLTTGLSWLRTVDHSGRFVWRSSQWFLNTLHAMTLKIHQKFKAFLNRPKKAPEPKTIIKTPPKPVYQPPVELKTEPKPEMKEKPKSAPPIKKQNRPSQLTLFDQPNLSLPSFSLLEAPTKEEGPIVTPYELEQVSRLVEARLKDFGVEVHVVAVEPGPVITRFEMELAAGVKVSKISGLAKDLARSLSVVSVRVVEIIPGKPVVGLEIPNATRQTVRLQEVLTVEEYEKAQSPLSMALGKDISGAPVIVDLAKMPHLLVAGTTGSGKSVGVNAMILSILYRAQPEEVRMIMIDPKMLELSIYEGIPHLLSPVVTDMKEAANALKWCVAEMERRYKLLATMGVRNMQGYNRKVKDAAKAGKPLVDPLFKAKHPNEDAPLLDLMPYIVVIVDEFADMIMVVGKKVEELIARIAQKARAAGIHLILATQRPSVDVITGLIKANIPTRIAFQVASRIDSRTILDQQGAEQLLGRGDMLYLPAGAGIPMRVHGAFVADQEVHSVVSDWKARGEPNYDESVLSGGSSSSFGPIPGLDDDEEGEELDELYDQAVAIVIESRKASISGVQRRLKIGYNRAARMIEQMEAAGVVSPMQSNGTREVLSPSPLSD